MVGMFLVIWGLLSVINFKNIMFVATFSVLGLSFKHALVVDNTQAVYLALACVVANLGWWCSLK